MICECKMNLQRCIKQTSEKKNIIHNFLQHNETNIYVYKRELCFISAATENSTLLGSYLLFKDASFNTKTNNLCQMFEKSSSEFKITPNILYERMKQNICFICTNCCYYIQMVSDTHLLMPILNRLQNYWTICYVWR